MSGELAAEVIEAAGGIVERDTPRGPLVAVIHRKRYGSEWALPKGKREAGKGWQATALREVEEELGLRPVIVGIAGATTHLAKGIPKFVLYWRMRVAQELAPFKPNEEVTRLEWLPPKAAIEQLTHREEKDLLGRIYSPEAEEMRPLTAWLEKLCTPILRRRAWRRLGSTISAYEAELEARAASGKFPSAGLEPINLVVRRARDAVENGDLETGWKCFLAAQRIEFLYLDGAELDAEAAAIAEEADKLTARRKKAVVATLSKTDGDAAKAAPRRVGEPAQRGGGALAAPQGADFGRIDPRRLRHLADHRAGVGRPSQLAPAVASLHFEGQLQPSLQPPFQPIKPRLSRAPHRPPPAASAGARNRAHRSRAGRHRRSPTKQGPRRG
jgi:8-oxo-dGTP diphosphatase